ncbi:hypothetical protein Adi01nite_44170 [Amorphoplanes digitatis]|nr:hypothetical protein Adi01nite_44170 [Actinoplanes digitatis]
MLADRGGAEPELGTQLGGGRGAALEEQLGHPVPGAEVSVFAGGHTEAHGHDGRRAEFPCFHYANVTYFIGGPQTADPVIHDTGAHGRPKSRSNSGVRFPA